MNVRVEAPDPDSDPAGLEPNFEVSIYTTEGYLDPITMEVKNGTTQEYATSDMNDLESIASMPDNTLGMRSEVSKSHATSIAGKDDAWRIEYVSSAMGSQFSFNVKGYVLGNDEKLYKLEFTTAPLEAPKTMSIGEKIIQSFRFI